jgi:hypothetical protein
MSFEVKGLSKKVMYKICFNDQILKYSEPSYNFIRKSRMVR